MVEIPDCEAKCRYRSRLRLAAIAVVEEKDKIRVAHDVSNGVHANHRIKVRDQVRRPGVGELRQFIREKRMKGAKAFMILGDVSKAYRRIKIKEQDWGMQACRLREASCG